MQSVLKSSHRIDEIECLRAVAILFTLIHHTAYFLFVLPNSTIDFIYSHFTFWGGVDLFFVISGFVIMKSFSQLVQEAKISHFKSATIFWIKRIFRILPPAWFWLGVYLLATIFINYTGAFGDLSQNLRDAKAAFLQYANIYGLGCWGKESTMSCGPNGIYWSLSLEEQFYFLLPIVFFIFRKYFTGFLILVLGLQFFNHRPEWSVLWAVRTDSLIWGVLIAIFSEKMSYGKCQPQFLLRFSFLRPIILISFLVAMAYFPAAPNRISLGTSLLGITCALMVFLASFDQGYLLMPGRLRSLLVWLGARSYSLYLTHIIAYRLAYEILYQVTPVGYKFVINDSYWLLLIAIPTLLIFSEFSFHFIEKPSREFGVKLSTKMKK